MHSLGHTLQVDLPRDWAYLGSLFPSFPLRFAVWGPRLWVLRVRRDVVSQRNVFRSVWPLNIRTHSVTTRQ